MHKYYWLLTILVAVVLVPVLWYVREHDPRTASYGLPCLFHFFTGLHCPGCGGTRAAHALLNGRIQAAIAWNPFVTLILPLLLPLVLFDQRRRKIDGAGLPYFPHIVLGIVVAVFVLRNIPSPQNAWLAPKDIEQSRSK